MGSRTGARRNPEPPNATPSSGLLYFTAGAAKRRSTVKPLTCTHMKRNRPPRPQSTAVRRARPATPPATTHPASNPMRVPSGGPAHPAPSDRSHGHSSETRTRPQRSACFLATRMHRYVDHALRRNPKKLPFGRLPRSPAQAMEASHLDDPIELTDQVASSR